ncbi:MAG: type IX secretion system sortase PorU, partial [Bacteroidetes bacterium]|nr:type IX secretion system sortase PorU [Bacteroidota bacterium]
MKCLLTALLLISRIAFSQTGERTILWETPLVSYDIDNPVYMMNFSGAFYPNPDDLLPVYFERIPMEAEYSEITVRLENTVFETAKSEDIKRIQHLDKIKSTINIVSETHSERKKPYLHISFVPLRKNPANQKIEKLIRFNLVIDKKTPKSSAVKTGIYPDESVLKTGNWVKVKVTQDGIYMLTYDDLVGMGFSDPSDIAVYGNAEGLLPYTVSAPCYNDLVENPVRIEKGNDDTFNSGDYILFYGKGPTNYWYDEDKGLFRHSVHYYSSCSYYFLTDKGRTKNFEVETSAAGSNTTVTSFDDYDYHETEVTNLIRSGRNWAGESFDINTSQNFSFSFPGLLTGSPVKLTVATFARYSDSSTFTVTANNQTYSLVHSSVNMSSEHGSYVSEKNETFSFNSSTGNINVTLTYSKPDPSAEAWLNYLLLNARRSLSLSGAQMRFRDINSVGQGNVSTFVISGAGSSTGVWDVTDPRNARQIEGTLSGNQFSFTVATDSLREFIVFSGASYLTPEVVGSVSNQNLHGTAPPDMVIVTYSGFLSYANQLAAHHRDHDGLSVTVTTNEQVYNEFSSGAPDVSAIRNFIKMYYDRAGSDDEIPKYLLLFGDGSYDNRTSGSGNTNYILTYQSDNSIKPTSSFVTDDYFAMLDDSDNITTGLLDIGVGRLPVKNTTEAQDAVNKIIHYSANRDCYREWRNIICFIGDDEDGNQHMRDADSMTDYVDTAYPVFNIDKIYLDAYVQQSTPAGQRYPDVNIAINNRVKKGALIINYTGHGGELGLAHESVVNINQIKSWNNYNNLPLFMTATCEFSRFDDFERTSAGEFIFLNPEGGGIGLFSTTRVVYASSNFTLNQYFYKYIFEEDSAGTRYRLGDVIRLTKNECPGSNTRNFTLLCDPALELTYPKKKVYTTKINSQPVSDVPDTLKALSLSTLEGYVGDETGNMITDFNGIVYISVLDKPDSIITLSNDGNTPFSFNIQNNILYKGKATVKNGEFSVSFIVPKDISYRIGKGKLSYYADNTSSLVTGFYDAAGYYRNVIIGGSADSVSFDNLGPEITMYMNDPGFVYGGITDEDPTFYAELKDSSGINTVGNGIGHDLTLVMDNNTSSVMILNDNYEAETDTYQKGKVEYYLTDLTPGLHTLNLKVWDVFNNSSEEDIEFIVAESSELALSHIFNYPNPFTTQTSFYFEHNQPNTG